MHNKMIINWQIFRVYYLDNGVSDQLFFTFSIFLVNFVCYYLHGIFFSFVDIYGILDRYKIRSNNIQKSSQQKVFSAIFEASLDSFVVKPLFAYLSFPLLCDFIVFREMPTTIWLFFIRWLLMEFIFSTSLYFIHYSLHRYFYRYHKKHHSFHYTIGLAAQYHHPIEAIVSISHILFAILLIRPHILELLVFLATVLVEIVDAHCGYDVPWKYLYPWSDCYFWGSGARLHDYHHSHNIGTYGGGLFGFWDRFFHTDKAFRSYEKKRMKTTSITGTTNCPTTAKIVQ
jgi:sterol desaturase/sphingolipid hydroxylase (fatty acid hydroxylase superfamily)